MSDVPAGAWSAFLEDVASSRRKLLGELADLHRNVREITAELQERYAAAAGQDWPRGQIAALRTIYETNAAALLLDPLERYARSRIHDRLPRGFEDFWSDLGKAVRKLPVRAEFTRASLIETLPAGAKLPLFSRWSGWRNRMRAVEVRQVVLGGLKLQAFRLGPVEGRVYLTFAQATLALLDPWRALRAVALLRLRGDDSATHPREFPAAWKQQTAAQEAGFKRVLESLDAALADQEVQLLGALLGPERRRRVGGKRARRRGEWEDYWARQQRAIQALTETEISLVQLGAQGIIAVEQGAHAVEEEHRAVVDELQASLDALGPWQPGQANPLPPGSAQLTPAREHTRQWKKALGGHARVLMPEEIEAVEPRRPLPGWRVRWRTVRPEQGFLATLDRAAEPVATVLEDVEADHKAVLQEIERAREVVTFGIQTAAETASGAAMAQESVGNAELLLKKARQNLPDRHADVEAAYVQVTAACFHQYHAGFEQGRLSLASYLAREGIARGLRQASRQALEEGRRVGLASREAVIRFYHAVLVKIGWEAPLVMVEAPVEHWRSLEDAADEDLGPRRLPLIYARLFRAAPVEDLRFLVGRETEMAALADARRLWDAGRSAAVVVYGQRGSGKTSLINCALARSFTDVDLVQGIFRDRVLTRQSMRSFLAVLLGTSPDDLAANLSSRRRVVVIEGVERTFLRKIGGLAALEELSRIMTHSVPSTLWIVSLTGEAYRYLDAAANLGRHFSQRINTSAVRPDHLREAILQRHNLSGLQLEFAGPPDGRRFGAWFHALTSIGEDAETAFFDAIYRRSGGIFRSAFGLWHRSIDRAAGGLLFMDFPAAENHAEIAGSFTRDDLFTLQMLLHHGSLTVEEHAEIFGWRREASDALVKDLLGRRIVEGDPEAPGVRIRPPAMVLARSALNAENLL